jgi:hypothetical protein
MSYQPPFPSGPQPGRSTPIPGGGPRSTPIGDGPFSAPAQDGPPTPSEFLGGVTPTDMPPPGAMGQFGVPQPFGMPPTYQRPKAKRSFGGCLLTLIIVGATAGGIGAAVWGVMKAKDTVDKVSTNAQHIADEYSDERLSDNDRAALGLTDGEQYLWEGMGMGKVALVLDAAIPGTPTMFTEIDFYTDYSFATAQNPQLPDHLDRYGWRVGEVSTPEPQSNDADAPGKVFNVTDVNWSAIAQAVLDAPRELNVEEGKVSYVFVSRDMFADGTPVVARIYVDGPRSSGYVEVDSAGNVLAKY